MVTTTKESTDSFIERLRELRPEPPPLSESPVTLHQWHRAEIWRTGKGILMKVDRQSWVESQLISIRGPLTEPGMLYIGGYDGNLTASPSPCFPDSMDA
ncbi:hypothetical protein OSTOST_16967 [Ostertagia ostertagi]